MENAFSILDLLYGLYFLIFLQGYFEFERILKFGDQTRNAQGCWQLLLCTINFYLVRLNQS